VTGELRCRHELLSGQCSLCRGIPDDDLYLAASLGSNPPRAGKLTAAGPALAARHASWCAGNGAQCTGWIYPGDPIVRVEELDAWVCAGCGGSG
jgi:hypothetical protein